MRKDEAKKLAARLPIGLGSPGVCSACLGFVAFALDGGNERRVAGQVTSIAPVLWGEGLDASVRAALEVARRRGDERVGDAVRELEARGFRSAIFRAVVRRLAVELREEAHKAELAALN